MRLVFIKEDSNSIFNTKNKNVHNETSIHHGTAVLILSWLLENRTHYCLLLDGLYPVIINDCLWLSIGLALVQYQKPNSLWLSYLMDSSWKVWTMWNFNFLVRAKYRELHTSKSCSELAPHPLVKTSWNMPVKYKHHPKKLILLSARRCYSLFKTGKKLSSWCKPKIW